MVSRCARCASEIILTFLTFYPEILLQVVPTKNPAGAKQLPHIDSSQHSTPAHHSQSASFPVGERPDSGLKGLGCGLKRGNHSLHHDCGLYFSRDVSSILILEPFFTQKSLLCIAPISCDFSGSAQLSRSCLISL